MKIKMQVSYCNGDNGFREDGSIVVETNDKAVSPMVEKCKADPCEQNFNELFRALYDGEQGIVYTQVWKALSHMAYDELGWHDVTVDVVGISIDDEELIIDEESGGDLTWLDEYQMWSLQLVRGENTMYCYN